jgi:hypothetical protein
VDTALPCHEDLPSWPVPDSGGSDSRHAGAHERDPAGPDTDRSRQHHRAEIAAEQGITRKEVVARHFDAAEPTPLIRRMIAPEEIAASVAHLSASPHLNGMAKRAEGGTIRAVL